jgi:hypothetical protein
MVRRIRGDLSCIYLASVDPGGLPRDRRLALRVRTEVADLTLKTRSHVIVLGEEARRRTRIESAALDPSQAGQDETMTAVVIPTGFDEKTFTALVQVALPPRSVADGAWDVGLTLEPERGKRRQVSQRVQLDRADVPVVVEWELEFPAAAYVLTAVASATPGDTVVATHVEGSWPAPDAKEMFVGSPVVIQPANAAFVRGDALRTTGSLGRTRRAWIDPDRPLALVGLVCRGSGGWPENTKVRRELSGASTASFEDFRPDSGSRCAMYRDVVPPGVLTSGSFTYKVEAIDDSGTSVAGRSDRLTVVSQEYLATNRP